MQYLLTNKDCLCVSICFVVFSLPNLKSFMSNMLFSMYLLYIRICYEKGKVEREREREKKKERERERER